MPVQVADDLRGGEFAHLSGPASQRTPLVSPRFSFPDTKIVQPVETMLHELSRLDAHKVLPALIPRLTPVEQAVIKTQAVARLEGVRQMGISRTEYGQGLQHNRLEHSIQVTLLAGAVAERLGLPARQVQEIRLAALLHDVGHTAFAHTGETAMQSCIRFLKWCHESRGKSILQSDRELQGVIRSHGFDHEVIVNLLRKHGDPYRHKFAELICGVDTAAYLIQDYQGTGFNDRTKQRAVEAVIKYFVNIVGYNDRGLIHARPDGMGRPGLSLALSARHTLQINYSQNPRLHAVNSEVIHGVHEAVLAGRMKFEDLMTLTDEQVLLRFDSERRRRLTEGVDKDFSKVLLALTYADLTQEGVDLIHGRNGGSPYLSPGEAALEEFGGCGLPRADVTYFEAILRTVAFNKGINPRHLHFGATPDFGKYGPDGQGGIEIQIHGESEPATIRCRLERCDRSIVAFVHRDVPDEVVEDARFEAGRHLRKRRAIQPEANEIFHPSRDYAERVFRPLQPDFFPLVG